MPAGMVAGGKPPRINELLDLIRSVNIGFTDQSIADSLGVAKQRISDFRSNRRQPTVEQTLALTKLANEDCAYWVMRLTADKLGRAGDEKLARDCCNASKKYRG